MRIKKISAHYPRWQQALGGWRPRLWQIVVRVESDSGVVGYGYGGGGEAALPIVNGHFRELLAGRAVENADDIAAIWDDLYFASIPYGRRGVGMMALSGVDLALWDLLGQALDRPVYDLLGGLQRPRVRAYASGNDPEWFAQMGFTACKFSHKWSGDPADYAKAIASAEAARRHLGEDGLVMADCYLSWDGPVTGEMARRLAPYNLYWFEDILTPDRLDEQAALRPAIKPVLLAGGEHEFTHYGFGEVARTGALDIWQPDVTWCGGITATLRIVELAKANGAQVVLHRGGEVWGLHIIAAGLCDDLGELVLGQRNAGHDTLWLGEPQAVEGFLSLSDAPGFGVRINQKMMG
ncbi:MAG TPA: enolase C-terminal domain-like protein [Caldilineaceae bacterium]|nr:enolase C-terminal domain-like protein [Caldilineaceae bacterium]